MTLRCLELFAGAGGAALGLERAGLHHAALCEWDRDACATLRAAGLGLVVEGDVRDLDAIAAAVGADPVDVLWSSFPCQAFSTAGKRLGAADERNGWPWTVAAIDRFRPTWLLGENVRGLLLHTGGCTFAGGQEGLFSRADPTACPGCYFERVILPDLRRRFTHVGWWLLDAADYGVPQHRRRVILWAGPRPLTEPAPTHGPGRAQGWVSMREALRLDGIVQSGVCDSACETRGAPRETSRPAPTVPVSSHLYHAGAEAFCFATHPEGAEGVADRRARRLSDGPCPTIGAEYTGTLAGHPWVASVRVVAPNRRPPIDYTDQPAPTIDSHTGIAGDAYEQALRVVDGETDRRRLTVAECARLQDFPAGHPFQGGSGAQYRQIGNAVPPRLAEVVGRALLEAAR